MSICLRGFSGGDCARYTVNPAIVSVSTKIAVNSSEMRPLQTTIINHKHVALGPVLMSRASNLEAGAMSHLIRFIKHACARAENSFFSLRRVIVTGGRRKLKSSVRQTFYPQRGGEKARHMRAAIYRAASPVANWLVLRRHHTRERNFQSLFLFCDAVLTARARIARSTTKCVSLSLSFSSSSCLQFSPTFNWPDWINN